TGGGWGGGRQGRSRLKDDDVCPGPPPAGLGGERGRGEGGFEAPKDSINLPMRRARVLRKWCGHRSDGIPLTPTPLPRKAGGEGRWGALLLILAGCEPTSSVQHEGSRRDRECHLPMK